MTPTCCAFHFLHCVFLRDSPLIFYDWNTIQRQSSRNRSQDPLGLRSSAEEEEASLNIRIYCAAGKLLHRYSSVAARRKGIARRLNFLFLDGPDCKETKMSIVNTLAKSFALGCIVFQFGPGWAQSYPAKPVRLLLPSSPGSGSDTIGRIIATGLSQVFNQRVIVENRPGGGSNIGAAMAAQAPADGYTVFQANMAHAVNATLYRKLAYDLLRDFAPVTQLATGPQVIVVHPSLPVKSVPDLVKLAKSRPGALNYASAGTGTPTFLSAELFKGRAGVDMLHVPYKGGGEALNAVVSGETSVYFAPVATGLPQIRQGRLRALAVTSTTRLTLLPEYPTVAETGFPGFEAGNWYGLVVPARTPKDLIATIHSAAIATLKKPDIAKRLSDLGYVAIGSRPEEFGAFMKSEIDKLGAILRKLGVTAD